MEKFTQGPWVVNKSIPTYIYNNEHGSICCIHFINSRELNNREESSANAALISAAPELYDALKNLKECLEIFFGKTEKDFLKNRGAERYFTREYIDACNALKKARGEK